MFGRVYAKSESSRFEVIGCSLQVCCCFVCACVGLGSLCVLHAEVFLIEKVFKLEGVCVSELFKSVVDCLLLVYDHTTLKTPVLVRSPKLSNVGPG